MTKRKRTKRRRLWSCVRVTHPQHPGFMVRVTELAPGGNLYVVRMVEGKQKMALLRPRCTRLDLGTNEQDQRRGARARAYEIIKALATGNNGNGDVEPVETGAALTLGTLATLYEKHGLHGVRANYRRDQVAKVRRIKEFLGPERLVVSLCRSDVDAFAAARLMHVSRNTVHGDIAAVKIACNWAVEHKQADGRALLDQNPLARVRVPKDTPRRPWITLERYEKLKAVADQLPPAFPCLLSVAWETGHRISAILALRWQDVSFATSKAYPDGTLRWYADVQTNKKQHDAVVPMNERALQALEKYRALCPGVASAWVFPSRTNPTEPLGPHVSKRWLRRAEELAGLAHEPRGAWHAFRRGWATKRKHLPLVDVAEAGGWARDSATLMKCYTHPDPATTLAVVGA